MLLDDSDKPNCLLEVDDIGSKEQCSYVNLILNCSPFQFWFKYNLHQQCGSCFICLISVIASQRARSSSNSRPGSYHNTSLNTSIPDSGYGSSGQSRSFSTQSSTFQTPNTSHQRGSSKQRLHGQQSITGYQRGSNQSRNNNSQISNRFNSPSVNIQRGNGSNNRGDNSRVPLLPVQTYNKGQSSDDNSVVCNCGDDGVLLTVRKEGPNTGMILLFI